MKIFLQKSSFDHHSSNTALLNYKTRASPLTTLSWLIFFLCFHHENLWSGFSLAWIPCGSFTIKPFHINTMTHQFASLTSTLNMNICVPVLNCRQPTAVLICAALHEITYKKNNIVNCVVSKGCALFHPHSVRGFVYASMAKAVV